MTGPLHSSLLLGNAVKRISELTIKSTVDQQPCKESDDHDIIAQLEAQNHDQFEMIKDMHPEFQRLCAVHASGALAPKNERLPLASGNHSRMEIMILLTRGCLIICTKDMKPTQRNHGQYIQIQCNMHPT